MSISRLRADYIKKISKMDVDYELPILMFVVIVSVVLMLTITV